MTEQTQTATRISDDSEVKSQMALVVRHHGGFVPSTPDEMMRIAATFVKSHLIPKSFDTVEKAFVALQYCYEQGLAPFSSMQWLMVQNGRVAEWGDLPVSRVLASGQCKDLRERLTGLGPNREVTDDTIAFVGSKRKDWSKRIEHSFSLADAKLAGLYPGDPKSAWAKYTKALLTWRAKHMHLRSCYADVLRGVVLAEDVPPVGVPAAQTFDPGKALGADPDHADLPVGRQAFGFAGDQTEPSAEDTEPVDLGAKVDAAEAHKAAETQPKPDDGTALFAPKVEAPTVRRSRARQKPDTDVVRRWTENICDKINEAFPGFKPGVAHAIGEKWLKTIGPENGLTWDDLADTTFQAEVKRLWDDVDWQTFR